MHARLSVFHLLSRFWSGVAWLAGSAGVRAQRRGVCRRRRGGCAVGGGEVGVRSEVERWVCGGWRRGGCAVGEVVGRQCLSSRSRHPFPRQLPLIVNMSVAAPMMALRRFGGDLLGDRERENGLGSRGDTYYFSRRTCTLALPLSHTHTHTHTWTSLYLSLSCFLSHTHTHSHTCSLSLALKHSQAKTVLSNTLTYMHTHTITHTHTHAHHTHTHTHTHTHARSHTHTQYIALQAWCRVIFSHCPSPPSPRSLITTNHHPYHRTTAVPRRRSRHPRTRRQ